MINSTAPMDFSCQRNGQFNLQQQRFRRESINSFGINSTTWNPTSVGSWLRDEVLFHNAPPVYSSPINSSSYLPTLEADFCKDYSCCGILLPNLHDLLRHYEEAHISQSPPVDPPILRRPQTAESVSTNQVFISTTPSPPFETDDDDDDDYDDDGDMCIDDPARRLYVMEHTEHRPFKCPVIGCDKSYKNQNGLKYHRAHGHINQTLHPNADGTYSVIDPRSNAPYPAGVEFEQDKPYRCEVCGKRYKNLNGLKYHRGHSTH